MPTHPRAKHRRRRPVRGVQAQQQKPSVGQGTSAAPALTQDAQDLLRSVEAGGVPMFATSNLKRIARENGITVADDMTPNQIVNLLREKT